MGMGEMTFIVEDCPCWSTYLRLQVRYYSFVGRDMNIARDEVACNKHAFGWCFAD